MPLQSAIFELQLVVKADASACLQVVLDAYKTQRSAKQAQPCLHCIVEALQYFNMPVERWPLGAQLCQRQAEQQRKHDQDAAQIMAAVKVQLASSNFLEAFGSPDLANGQVRLQTKDYLYVAEEQGGLEVGLGPLNDDGYVVSTGTRAALEQLATDELMQVQWGRGGDGFKVSVSFQQQQFMD